MNIGMLLHPYGERKPGGLGRAVYEIAKHLVLSDEKDSFTLYFKEARPPRPVFPGTNWTYYGLGSKNLWLTGGKNMNPNLDLYLFFTPMIPLFFRPKRSIVFALDFAYRHFRHSWKDWVSSWVLTHLHTRALRAADAVIAISEQTKEEAIRISSIAPDKVAVVPLAAIPLNEKPEETLVPDQFFLFAGVLKERKNVAGVIRAFALFAQHHPGWELCIAGKEDGAYAASLKRLVAELGLTERVRFLGYVSNARLAYLYRKARALVFPSLLEGFGMPVLEAMHAGLPVITAHAGALAEVAGDAALLVDPYSPADIARAMEDLARDNALRAVLIKKGKDRARLFSWERTAQGILTVIQRVCEPV